MLTVIGTTRGQKECFSVIRPAADSRHRDLNFMKDIGAINYTVNDFMKEHNISYLEPKVERKHSVKNPPLHYCVTLTDHDFTKPSP